MCALEVFSLSMINTAQAEGHKYLETSLQEKDGIKFNLKVLWKGICPQTIAEEEMPPKLIKINTSEQFISWVV